MQQALRATAIPVFTSAIREHQALNDIPKHLALGQNQKNRYMPRKNLFPVGRFNLLQHPRDSRSRPSVTYPPAGQDALFIEASRYGVER